MFFVYVRISAFISIQHFCIFAMAHAAGGKSWPKQLNTTLDSSLDHSSLLQHSIQSPKHSSPVASPAPLSSTGFHEKAIPAIGIPPLPRPPLPVHGKQRRNRVVISTTIPKVQTSSNLPPSRPQPRSLPPPRPQPSSTFDPSSLSKSSLTETNSSKKASPLPASTEQALKALHTLRLEQASNLESKLRSAAASAQDQQQVLSNTLEALNAAATRMSGALDTQEAIAHTEVSRYFWGAAQTLRQLQGAAQATLTPLQSASSQAATTLSAAADNLAALKRASPVSLVSSWRSASSSAQAVADTWTPRIPAETAVEDLVSHLGGPDWDSALREQLLASLLPLNLKLSTAETVLEDNHTLDPWPGSYVNSSHHQHSTLGGSTSIHLPDPIDATAE